MWRGVCNLIQEFVDRQAVDTDLVELTDQQTGEARQYRTKRLETVTEPGTPLNKQTLDPLLHAIRGVQDVAGNPVSIPETVASGYPFAVDIHPAATIGCGILLDHATSFVVGETAIIRDNVSILHEVTLGGTGKEEGDRHPIVESGVLIGAGAKILGRVTIGACAKIAACSVVLENVPPHTTVAGVPAVIVNDSIPDNPALDMNQCLCD